MQIIDDPKYPKDEHNTQAVYVARWIKPNGLKGCSTIFSTPRRAQAIAAKHGGKVYRQYVGGFAF